MARNSFISSVIFKTCVLLAEMLYRTTLQAAASKLLIMVKTVDRSVLLVVPNRCIIELEELEVYVIVP